MSISSVHERSGPDSYQLLETVALREAVLLCLGGNVAVIVDKIRYEN